VHEQHRRNAMELLTEILQRYNLSQL